MYIYIYAVLAAGHTVSLVDEQDATSSLMHCLEDLFLCLANILALQRGARDRRDMIARQDVQVL